jgi:hypothetical protein
MTVVAFAMDVSVDHDETVDFSKYKTFIWIHPPMLNDPLMRQRIGDAVNRMLQEKGVRLVSSPEEADLGLIANGATEQRQTLQTFYDTFPAGWGWGGWGTARTVIDTYQVGTLVMDMFDMGTKRVVWRGVATDTLSDKPEKNTKKINKAVKEMLEDFPPKRT